MVNFVHSITEEREIIGSEEGLGMEGMWEGLPGHRLRLEVTSSDGGERLGFDHLLVLRVPGKFPRSMQGAPGTVVGLAVQPWAVGVEEGDTGVGVLLHQLQGCSQLSCEALAHCLRARAERLN